MEFLRHVDQNKNGAKYLEHYLKVYCLTISVFLSQHIRYHWLSTKTNLVHLGQKNL